MQEQNRRRQTLMQLDVSLTKKILITILIMLVLIAFVYYFNIPNPNMILIAGLVLCSALFGFGGGIVAAVIMLFYTLYFFSTDNSFIQFTPENMQKVGVSLVGIVVDMVLVCSLKRAEMQAFSEVHDLTEQLHEENERLKDLSMVDALTRVRNRLALRHDYDSFKGHEVTVMMLDLDDFKSINDTQGHAEGDRMLQETGRLLSDTFGNEHCYRYGGDEFLIIVPDISEEEFKQKLEQILTRRPKLMLDGKETKAGFSFGYVHDHLNESVELRKLISAADERMYNAKRNK